MLRGLGLPNTQWRLYSNEEVAATYDLNPDGLLIIGYPDSPILAEKIAQEALIWEKLNKPKMLLRPYAENIITFNPSDWAETCYDLLFRYYQSHITGIELIPANEFNIEGGGEDWISQILWLEQFITTFRTLDQLTPVHLPALSPSGDYLSGYAAYSVQLAQFDIIDLHCYTLDQLNIIPMIQDMFTKPACITEINQISPIEYNSIHPNVPKYWFILNWDNPQPEMPNVNLINSQHYEAFKQVPDQQEDSMLKDQFPTEFQQWTDAGGDSEEAFRFYLMGQGKLPSTKDFLISMADNLSSHLEELKLGISFLA